MASEVPEWDLPDRMRKALREAGMGVQDMADYLNVSRNTISAWINGRGTANIQALRLWAIKTSVPFDWLLEGEKTDMWSNDLMDGGAVETQRDQIRKRAVGLGYRVVRNTTIGNGYADIYERPGRRVVVDYDSPKYYVRSVDAGTGQHQYTGTIEGAIKALDPSAPAGAI